MKKLICFLVPCLLQMSLAAQDNVTVGKFRKFESKILGGEVIYAEHLPDGYETSGKAYPVVFTMNGQNVSQFANDAATLDNLSNDRIPDMILIGISNTGVADTYWSCPDDSGQVQGGKRFGAFMKEELIPEIEKNYRTNGYRILSGQSNTGLFAMYTFLSDPEMFNAYVIASPMFGWCPGFFLDKTKDFLTDHPGLRKKLYISYGDLDYVQVLNPLPDFKEVLKRSPAGLDWEVDLIENASHVPYTTLNNALLFFFSGCTMNAERRKLGVPEIKSHFEALSKEYGFTVNPKAAVLFDMVIDMADEQKPDQAIELNKYLVSLYPDSEIYYYYLGKLYQKKGDAELAKENYRHALKINPDFETAKKAMNKLENEKDNR
jgi:uncharacterized protein